jgi:hypothetical protein
MHITSPFVVVPVIITIFLACILWGTSSKDDSSSANDSHSAH